MHLDVIDKLKQIAQTRNDVLLLTSSGTGSMEAAIVNFLSPGDKVLSVSIGVFGDRFATIAQQFGAEVVSVTVEWGKAADPEEVRQAIKDNPDVKAVLVTHNETSTGVTNDLCAISKTVKEAGKLIIVDAISSLGSINLPIDEWKCDVVITGSQKGWMVPPGMAMVYVSDEAWKVNSEAKMPRFYWDLKRAKTYVEKGQNPWTPAVGMVFALSASLELIVKEGIQNVFERHTRIARITRDGVKALGLPLFAEESHASNTITAIAGTEGLDIPKLRQIMSEKHKITLSGGQQRLDGKIFRIGHLGYVNENEIKEVFSALKVALPEAGFNG
jgi:aspartate aminotransferase-like enzyme